MRERALELARAVDDPARRLNVLREYLQASVLRSLHESEAFGALSFVGGTALRFLYDLQRFSEDLDFSLESPETYAPVDWLGKLKRDFGFAGFDADITWNDRKTVHVGWIRTAGLLREGGLSSLDEQKLAVKLEIDTRPPAGARTENRIVNRHFLVAFRHHDLPSLMAGKVHSLMARGYPKGRDWYDLVWYSTRTPRIEPNVTLLQSALDQTDGESVRDAASWREMVLEILAGLDLGAIRNDVSPFLERPADADLLTEDNLRRILES